MSLQQRWGVTNAVRCRVVVTAGREILFFAANASLAAEFAAGIYIAIIDRYGERVRRALVVGSQGTAG